MRFLPVIAAIAAMALLITACTPMIAKSSGPSLSPSSAPASSPSPASTLGTGEPAASVQLITPANAKTRMDSGDKVLLVDVRTAEEYAEGHIAGSLLIPVDSITTDAETKLPDKDALLFVYCRSGRRSAIAASQLLTMGYTQVYDLGGIISWPYEVVKE